MEDYSYEKKVLLMAGVLALTLCSACGKTADTQKQNPQEEVEEEESSEEVSGKEDSEEELSGEKGLPEETVETKGVSEEKDLPDEKESGDQETEQQPSFAGLPLLPVMEMIWLYARLSEQEQKMIRDFIQKKLNENKESSAETEFVGILQDPETEISPEVPPENNRVKIWYVFSIPPFGI